jgi:hypothetical protein
MVSSSYVFAVWVTPRRARSSMTLSYNTPGDSREGQPVSCASLPPPVQSGRYDMKGAHLFLAVIHERHGQHWGALSLSGVGFDRDDLASLPNGILRYRQKTCKHQEGSHVLLGHVRPLAGNYHDLFALSEQDPGHGLSLVGPGPGIGTPQRPDKPQRLDTPFYPCPTRIRFV